MNPERTSSEAFKSAGVLLEAEVVPLQLIEFSFLLALLVLQCLIVGVIAFFLFKSRHLIRGLFGSFADLGAEGGTASAAARGSRVLLAEIMGRVLSDASGGISDVARALIPDLDQWLKKNPFALLALLKNPMVQQLIAQFAQNFQRKQEGEPQAALPAWGAIQR